jgi:HK97 family phage major capsid protein
LTTTRKAVTQLEDQFMTPDAWVFAPGDWEEIELAQDDNHRYYNNDAPVSRSRKMLWGVPVITSSAMPGGEAILGAFAESCFIQDRELPRIDWSENMNTGSVSHFALNQIVFRCEECLGFAVTRPFGFCITSLSA